MPPRFEPGKDSDAPALAVKLITQSGSSETA